MPIKNSKMPYAIFNLGVEEYIILGVLFLGTLVLALALAFRAGKKRDED
jgi:hypothetical protein